MTDRDHARRSVGFTLMEMMVVVIILAIVGALAVPMFGSDEATRLRGAADMMAADIAFAQIESITHSEDPCLVVFNSNTATYYIARLSAPNTPITNPIDKQPYSVTFGVGKARHLQGVTISAYSLGGDDRIKFGIFGQLDQAAWATITITAGNRSIQVAVDPVSGESNLGWLN